MATDALGSVILVTLFVNGFWQPTATDTGRTGRFCAYPSRYVVDKFLPDGRFTGAWHGHWPTEEEARRFAITGGSHDAAREVPQYWYCPAYGRVEPDEVSGQVAASNRSSV